MVGDVLFYANAMAGIGHYCQIENIAEALRRLDPRRKMIAVYGGLPWPDGPHHFSRRIGLPQLCQQSVQPPTFVGRDGEPLEAVLPRRRAILRDALAGRRIDLIVLEFYPFSRQYLAEEVELILAMARRVNPAVRVVSSVRDIFRERVTNFSDPATRQHAESFVHEHLDCVLVHADKHFFPFESNWGCTPSFADKLRYTGLVIPSLRRQTAQPPHVCVSIGTGWTDVAPIAHFLKAWQRLCETRSLPSDLTAIVFPGAGKIGHELEQLREQHRSLFDRADNRVQWGQWDDYRNKVVGAAASVSACGYNTCYELLALGIPSVFVPLQVEQRTRAELVQQRGWGWMAEDDSAIADGLLAALQAGSVAPPSLDFNGAERSAHLLHALLEDRDRPLPAFAPAYEDRQP